MGDIHTHPHYVKPVKRGIVACWGGPEWVPENNESQQQQPYAIPPSSEESSQNDFLPGPPVQGDASNEGVHGHASSGGVQQADGQAAVPEQHGADVLPASQECYTGILVQGRNNQLVPMAMTGKAFKRTIPNFFALDALTGGQLGGNNKHAQGGGPPGSDFEDEPPADNVFFLAPPHDCFYLGPDPEHPLTVLNDFKQGSTQTPALPEEVERGDFDEACREEWLKNIVGKGVTHTVLGRVVDRKEVDSVMCMGWRLTWKEKETKQAEKKKEENKQEEEKAGIDQQSRQQADGSQGDREAQQPRKYKGRKGRMKENEPRQARLENRKPKARCFRKGFTDKRAVDTYVGTPSVWAILMFCIFSLTFCLSRFVGDISGAFLTTPDKNEKRAAVIIPDWLPYIPAKNPYKGMNNRDYKTLRKAALEIKPGELRLVEKGLYGMPAQATSLIKALQESRVRQDTNE
uniref:Uncharacterized protein n=1 Tax=Chromera velia CCMP2878 TaxID=1169474 RepID=A0A0G4F3Q7_9ALVE|eukprot:Cvel_14878.t1-p1 / transcript=Cvel_14878.t1 / gene=Cvel_14878 / organism=Chromera_velia_CCMP2878 / gene_product=hypothetical protein / transcript_product=hypothetical protein / location=Cvel_scaffold1076:26004-27677(+) / protein_length=459 / sequence_SO=supercontig / SO=protein_coding / is_pseudo=false